MVLTRNVQIFLLILSYLIGVLIYTVYTLIMHTMDFPVKMQIATLMLVGIFVMLVMIYFFHDSPNMHPKFIARNIIEKANISPKYHFLVYFLWGINCVATMGACVLCLIGIQIGFSDIIARVIVSLIVAYAFSTGFFTWSGVIKAIRMGHPKKH
jgi:hypothetical protein